MRGGLRGGGFARPAESARGEAVDVDAELTPGVEQCVEQVLARRPLAVQQVGAAVLAALDEVVPHHGPIIPAIANHQIVPRTATQALSVKYTGYEPTFEIRALWNLGHAATVDAGFRALADFSYGSQNWTMIDNQGNIGWTTNAVVPVRAPAAHTWDPVTQPDGLAPRRRSVRDAIGRRVDPRDRAVRAVGHPHRAKPVDDGVRTTADGDPV